MEQIYKIYDSTAYLTFDIKYSYHSDTLFGKFTSDVLAGSYTLAGKKAKYNLGDIDFIQNDSFFIAVYNTEKYIIITDPPYKNSGSGLPMRQLIDSMINNYDNQYLITVDSIDQLTSKINFLKKDSLAVFSNFSISYDSRAFLLKSIEYDFEEPDVMDADHSPIEDSTMDTTPSVDSAIRKKNLKIEFSNYRGDNFSDSVYSENNYVFFEAGVYKPVKKYRNFQVFNSKVGKIPDEVIEEQAP